MKRSAELLKALNERLNYMERLYPAIRKGAVLRMGFDEQTKYTERQKAKWRLTEAIKRVEQDEAVYFEEIFVNFS